MGGRQSNAEYQYTLQSDDSATLYEWVPKIVTALTADHKLADVNSDLQQGGLQTNITINRATASRLGITPQQIDATLYNAFGQRNVSTIYNELNQYEVVMEFAQKYTQTPVDLNRIYVSTSGGTASGTSSSGLATGSVVVGTPATATTAASTEASIAQDSATNAAINAIATGGKGASSGAAVSTDQETMVPLSELASYSEGTAPITINHQDGRVAATISFNLLPGEALGTAAAAITKTMSDLDVPTTITGSFAGTAAAFQSSQASEPLLILAALASVYIILGILYESWIHPLTIISTIPSAGLGATLILLIVNVPLSIIALIGIILLIGIVKKNAILMIDFALQLERGQNLAPEEAILQAAVLRFRPILMTTFAAIFGAVPLALGLGAGSELRQPLGITIIGGLLVSQVLTLYTTPVVYLGLDRLATRVRGRPDTAAPRAGGIVEAQ
jgi:multidrug efflux pump